MTTAIDWATPNSANRESEQAGEHRDATAGEQLTDAPHDASV